MKRFSEVKFIDRNQIEVRTKIFQNRNSDFSQASVDKIVREGFDTSIDPIVVWFDKDTNKYIVLSGHSRFEASRRLYESGAQPELAQMPVKEFLGDFEEAVYFANVESNRQGEAESLIGDLRAFERAKAQGCLSKECLKGVFKTETKIKKLQELSQLNPEGRFLEELDKEHTGIYPNLELYARWTGNLRETFTQISDSHENEIFSWLYAGKEGGTNFLPTKEEFNRLIENKVNNFGFNPAEPLNLKNAMRKTVYELNADEQITELNREIKNLTERNNQLNALMQRGLEKEQAGGDLPKNFEEWETEFSRNNRAINKKKLRIAEIQDKVKTLNVRDIDLFAQSTESEPKKETAPKAQENTLPAKRDINQLEPYELTFEEFVQRYKKYKGKNFKIGKTDVTYLPKSDKYKMGYALPTGMQTYTGDFIEVLRKAYDNVVERATKEGKTLPTQTTNTPEGTLSMFYEGAKITEEELRKCFEENAEPERVISFTKANFKKEFETGIITSKIGQDIVFNDRVYDKLSDRYRQNILGLIRPTLESPILVVKSGDNGNLLYFKSFKKSADQRLFFLLSVSKELGLDTVSSSNYAIDFHKIVNEANNGAVVWYLCLQEALPTFGNSGNKPPNDPANSIISDSKDTQKNENAQTKEQKFIQKIQANIADCENGEGKPFNKTQRGKIGDELGITAQKEVKELTELAIVMYAREIALREGLSVAEKYQKITDIYECQPVISEQDSTNKSAQQYSTSAPEALAMVFEEQEITEEELFDCFRQYAENLRTVSFTKTNFRQEFEADGIGVGKIVSKIGQEIVFNDRVYTKLSNRYRMDVLGLIRPTLENPILVVRQDDGNHLYFKSFLKDAENRLLFMLSVSQEMNNMVVSASNYDLPFYDVVKNTNKGEIVFFLCSQGTSLTRPRPGSQEQPPVESVPNVSKDKDTQKNGNAKGNEKITWQLAYQRYQKAKSPTGKAKYENILLGMVRTGEPVPNNVLGELSSEKVQEAMLAFLNLPTQNTSKPAKIPLQGQLEAMQSIYKFTKSETLKGLIKALKQLIKISKL